MRVTRLSNAWRAGRSGSRLSTRCQVLGATSGGAVGLLVLAGYCLDFRPAWRLASGLPATHPLTAICLVLMGFGLHPSVRSQRRMWIAARIAVLTAAVIVMLRLAAPVIGVGILNEITPFRRIVSAQALAGKPILLGVNAARVLLAIALSEILRWYRWPTASQTLACCAIGLLFVALIGYIDGLTSFHGALAPQSLIGCLALAVTSLFAMPRHGFMRALIARAEPARLARLLLGCSTPLIVLIGWAMSKYIRDPGNTLAAAEFLAYQTATIIILTWILVAAATMRADRIDRRRRTAERSLLRAATTDALTGLLSRNRMEQLRILLDPSQPRPRAGKLFIDLDRFRAVNEAFGHAVGDELLIEVGRRLLSIADGHPVGRVGGDEFGIYCIGITPEDARMVGFAATTILATPFKLRGRSFHLTASVGIAHTDTVGDTDLRQAADSAMHVAKRQGGNQAAVFTHATHEDRRIEIELEQDLYEALQHGEELSLLYQPVVSVQNHVLLAVEALARWMHPRLGPIPPERFIRLAEATGLIVPLGLKLMAVAVRQAALWRDRYPDGAPVINLNISPAQFAGGDIISDLVRMLWEKDLPTSAICIEVTESAFSDAHAIRALEDARRAGFNVAMDDFGVGYSSLSQLPRLPLVSVKLDRGFILDAATSPRGVTMLAAIVKLAHGLGLIVIAEGVERPEQLDLVVTSGCDAVQGYLFARPLKPEDLEIWLAGGIRAVDAMT